MGFSARNRNVVTGLLKTGANNSITDIKGVKVGHYTVHNEKHHTGITVISPREQMFFNKCVAASYVINGFGKTAGLVQIDELGTLETPIVLTNTMNVGKMQDALISYMLKTEPRHEEIKSINTVVGECNDSVLNDIQDRVLSEKELFMAFDTLSEQFDEGSVGAGSGMICHGLKGGIGSASRVFEIDNRVFTLGVLTLCNHGRLDELMVSGKKVGTDIQKKLNEKTSENDKGSCIIVVATDLPVSSRQLKRIIKRSAAGLARVGSYYGHGSGDIAIGFTTAHNINDENTIGNYQIVAESELEKAFAACAEATEEAVLNSLYSSETVVGYSGKTAYSINDVL